MKKYPPTPEELRDWMNRKGLSNKEVAKALRLSDGRVVRFWTSKKDPPAHSLPKLVHLAPQIRQIGLTPAGARRIIADRTACKVEVLAHVMVAASKRLEGA